MKALILYYSYGGNTRRIAERMQKILDCDLAEIETVTPYTGSYDSVVDQGQRKADSGFEPEIKPLSKNPADYDIVVLGTPVWWYTPAPAVKTALSATDWTGKTVYPFATNGGWIGHTFKDFEKTCQGATVKKELNIRFDEHTLRTPEAEIDRWTQQIQTENA